MPLQHFCEKNIQKDLKMPLFAFVGTLSMFGFLVVLNLGVFSDQKSSECAIVYPKVIDNVEYNWCNCSAMYSMHIMQDLQV